MATSEAKVLGSAKGERWIVYNGDCCEVLKSIPTNSVHFNIHSPPFAALYIYSDSEADMGNCSSDEEFFAHYRFAINEMFRVTVPGRLVAVHCKDLPKYANVWGTTGLIDFPGACIQEYESAGWVFHSRITIWKCPVTERERTNNNGLLHKTVIRDSSQLRQGMADYLILFRKPPSEGNGLMSDIPVKRFEKITKVNGKRETVVTEKPIGFDRYVGAVHYQDNDNHPSPFARKTKAANPSIDIWRRYAEPVWWDINQTRVLNHKLARGDGDEKHICLAKGSLVLTKDEGHKPIEEVQIGDFVLTHKGRWRPVIAKQNTGTNPVVRLLAHGVDMRLTPTHRIFARNPGTKARKKDAAKSADPEWIEAQHSVGSYVNLKLPETEEGDNDELTWWIVGRWIADGHFDARGGAHISCGNEKLDQFIGKIGDVAGFRNELTATQVRLRDPEGKIRSILSKCGSNAHSKRLPPEAFTLPVWYANSLLEGYLSGDGFYLEKRNRWYATSVSRELLLGIKFLVQRVHGEVASLIPGRGPRVDEIQGRKVNARQEWNMSWGGTRHSFSFLDNEGAWKKIRSAEPDGESETWNLRVLEDESFTAEGCVVKNCPLQLDVIERAIEIWSLEDEIVLSPFSGVGSEGVGAVSSGRRFLGVELKTEYFNHSVSELTAAEKEFKRKLLF